MTWMLHVTGVSKLVQQRGPASFSTTFDKVLLRSVRPMIVCVAPLVPCLRGRPG